MKTFISQIKPWIDKKELEQLTKVIESTYITENRFTKLFEDRIMEYTCAKHAVSMSNGTVALYCALKAMGIQNGDEVIVPDLTFIASSNAVLMAGGVPVFCDIDKKTLCIDVNKIESLITRKTKFIMPVHLYGNACEMDEIMAIAQNYELKVIEDAAQGMGVLYRGKHVGTIGDCGVLSFYGNKTITCGEGGVVLTNNEKIARSCYRLKNHGRDEKGVFKHEHIGFNFSFTEIQAAVGISQMNKLQEIIDRKRNIKLGYSFGLHKIEDISFPTVRFHVKSVDWFTSVFTSKREELKEYLTKRGIQTRDFFYPLHLQPCYNSLQFNANEFPNSEWAYQNGLSLPSSYDLTAEDQEYIIDTMVKFYDKSR